MKINGFVIFFVLYLISFCAFAADVTTTVQAAPLQPAIAASSDTRTAVEGKTFYGLTFQVNSSVIPVEAFYNLSEIINIIGEYINEGENPKIQINGFTDSTGTAEYNIKLSRDRAEAVMKYILKKYKDKRLKEGDVTVTGMGATNFIGDNSTDDGRSRNRRIELIITGKTLKTKVIIGETEKKEVKPAPAAQKENEICWQCIGLGVLDIGLAAYTAYTVSGQWKAADNYNTNYSRFNNPQGSNYSKLVSLEKIVYDKNTSVVVGSCLAGAAIAYTAADYFWLHIVFPADVKAVPVISNNSVSGVMLAIKGAF